MAGRGEPNRAWLFQGILLVPYCGRMLILMCREIKRKLAWIGWIGAEPLTADRTGIFTGPNAFAFSVCHHRPQADFFRWHRENLCGKLSIMQTVLACNLNAINQENLHRYTDLFKRVQAAITDRRELEDGYVFRLDGDSISLLDVAQWISLERLCCPFFTFQLQTKGGEADCWLTLRGPDGAKAIIDQEFAAVNRHTSTGID
jgi:hypothetical protein